MPAPEVHSSSEQGQMFSAWILGLFLVAAMILYVTNEMRRARNDTQSMVYRELALNIAKAGFEDGLSYFRTHSNGCYLNSVYAPTSQSWVTPWPTYPDAAFLPQAADTDFYSSISQTTSPLGICAKGIIGDFSMNQYVTYTGADQMMASSLWGRYVIRRQNTQNWSPGPDTASVNTDVDACHDLSAIATQSALGSGTRWSIVSHGYLLRLPSPVTTTSYSNTLLGTAAAFEGKDLLSQPLAYYNNQPFLLAQARVYGELSRINFNLPSSAILVPVSGDLTVNTNGILSNGINGSAWTAGVSAACNCGSGSVSGVQNNTTYMTPTIANCFPGQTWSSLRELAQSLSAPGGQIQGYVGGVEQLPIFEGTNTSVTPNESFSTQVNEPAFYFLTSSISLSGSGDVSVLSGVGLCVIEGNLTIAAGNNSAWDGVLYVEGNVVLDGPTSITGILISQGTITMGNSVDLNKTTVSYDANSLTLVQTLLKTFTVDSSSIVATEF